MSIFSQHAQHQPHRTVHFTTGSITLSHMLRMYLCLSVALTEYVAIEEPYSLSHMAIVQAGPQGLAFAGALFLLSIVGLLDLIINDILPDRFRMQWAWNTRHIIYMLMALGLASVAVMIAKRFDWTPVVCRYLLDAAFAAAVGFVDLFARRGK